MRQALSILLFLLTINSYAQITSLGQKATHWWDFETNNSTQNDRVGTNNGTVSGATYNAGGYYSFDGTDDKITVGNIIIGTNMSISAWFRSSVTTTRKVIGRYFGQYSVGYSNDYFRGVFNADAVDAVGANVPTVSQWNHAVFTYDGSSLRIYINGVLSNSASYTVSEQNSGNPWQIGANGNDQYYWQGDIDEVGMFNEALSLSEVQTLYNSGTIPDFDDWYYERDASIFLLNNNLEDENGRMNLTSSGDVSFSDLIKIEGTHSAYFEVEKKQSLQTSKKIDLTQPYTIILSVYCDSEYGFNDLFVCQSTSSEKRLQLSYHPNTLHLFLTGWEYLNDYQQVYGEGSITPNTWHRIAIRDIDPTDMYINLFLNGQRDGEDSIFTGNYSLNDTVYFGTGVAGSKFSDFAGYIDAISIYNRALTDTEIAYESLHPGFYLDGSGIPEEPEPPLAFQQVLSYSNYYADRIIQEEPETPEGDSVPIIVYAENFDGLPTGTVDRTQAANLFNMRSGTWVSNKMSIAAQSGRGNVFRVQHDEDAAMGNPLANTKIMLDSVYRDLYYQYDIYFPDHASWGAGGKTFGGFHVGPEADIPYRADTANSGSHTLIMFNGSGTHIYYMYTHNAMNVGWPLTESVQIPTLNVQRDAINSRDYRWFWGSAYGINAMTAWPIKSYWDGDSWEYVSQLSGGYSKGEWQTFTVRLRLSNDGTHNDFYEIYKNGVLIKGWDNLRFRIPQNADWGIEALYLNSFFGGSTPLPEIDQYWLIDNMVAYYLPSGHSDFSPTMSSIGKTIPLLYPESNVSYTTPARPVNLKFTEASGTICSHPGYYAFNHMPGPYDPAVSNSFTTISVAGATTYSLTMQQYSRGNPNVYYKQRVRIYGYNSGHATLVKTYDIDNYTLTTTNMTCDSVVIDYNVGEGAQYKQTGTGWRMTYTTNGTGSGTNPVYKPASAWIATKPE